MPESPKELSKWAAGVLKAIIDKLLSVAGKRRVWRSVSNAPPYLDRDGEAAFYVDLALKSFSRKKHFSAATLMAGNS